MGVVAIRKTVLRPACVKMTSRSRCPVRLEVHLFASLMMMDVMYYSFVLLVQRPDSQQSHCGGQTFGIRGVCSQYGTAVLNGSTPSMSPPRGV